MPFRKMVRAMPLIIARKKNVNAPKIQMAKEMKAYWHKERTAGQVHRDT